MKLVLALAVLLFMPLSLTAASDYTLTIIKREPLAAIPRPEHQPSTNLPGKSITALFGPLSEARLEWTGFNKTGFEGDIKKLQQRIREGIDHAKSLGRKSEVAWHMAPWVHGYFLFKDGRILPVEIFLSGIIVGDLLFTTMGEPGGGAEGTSPVRDLRR